MIFSLLAIILTIPLILLVSLNIIKVRWYASIIYLIGLLAVWSTTTLGLSVVGTDISRELQMSNFAMANGWNLSLFDVSNSSFVVGWLIPQFSKLFEIPVVWIYKLILPMIFALTPVLLYYIFKKQIGELKAFYSSIFFIMVPVFSLEIATIGKSMVAETLMALCLWIMFTNWKSWKKFTGILVFTLLTLWAHYTVGILLVCYFIGILLIMLAAKIFKKWELWKKKAVPLWTLAVVIVISITGFTIYYSNVSQGLVFKATAGIGDMYNRLGNIFLHNPPVINTSNTTSSEFSIIAQASNLTTEDLLMAQFVRQTQNKNPLLNLGMGKDFEQASVLGKIFRLIQYLTELLIMLGAVWLVFNYKKYNFQAEFIAGIASSFIMLAFCMFLPIFASLINMTRNYHMALFFLAPMFVLGVDTLCSTKKKESVQ